MRKILLTCMLLVGVSVSAVSQNSLADRDNDRYISYQIDSQSAELMKAQFAERLQRRSVQSTAFKSTNHPVIGANIKNYTPHNTGSNGLSDVYVRFVEEDSEGNLYFSTFGIDRWNGYEWENFNPMNSGIGNTAIHDMLEDKNGNFWVASYSGLVRIDAYTGEMRMITDFDGMRSRLVYTLHESNDGRIFAGHRWTEESGGGVSVLNYNGFIEYTFGADAGLYGESIVDFAEHDGSLYIATASDPNTGEFGGINVYDLVGDSIKTVYNTDNSGIPYNEVNRLAVDDDGTLWAGFFTSEVIDHTEGGLVRFDGTNWTQYSQDKGDNVGINIRDLAFDSNGTLWIASAEGVHTYNGQSFTSMVANVDENVSLTNLTGIKELSDGRIALSTFNTTEDNGGVFFYDPASSTWDYLSSSTDNGANSQTYFGADYDSKGNLWVTGFYGLQKYDGSNWQTFTENDGLLYTYGWDLIVDSNDNVWVNSSANGLTRINANGSIDIIDAYGPFVESNYEAKNGDMFFGDFYGDYDGDGDVESNGILHYNGTNYVVYDSTDGLPGGQAGAVISISEDQQGRILAATYGGLYRLESGTFTKWEFDGYNNAAVYKLHLDSQDRLWINDGGRTAMYDGTNWEYFDRQDGLDGLKILKKI